ncbi:MAG: glycosyltransferase [Deltaproteobacteria bacterium]|nr:MAG: glycosyltransferase [Deltaproteobacteria bacterium]
MKVLFVVPPLTGHILPTLAVAEALSARGHAVAWLGHATKLRGLLPEGSTILPLGEGDPAHAEFVASRARSARGMAALKLFWEEFVAPLALASFDETEALVRAHAPDVMVVDHQAMAGALVARKLGIPFATSATTSASVGDTLEAFPKVAEWQREQVQAVAVQLGVDGGDTPDVSDSRVLVFSTPELAGTGGYPPQTLFVGPSLTTRRVAVPFPWEWLEAGRRKVLVSLGTLNAERGQRFYDAVVEGLGGLDAQVVLVAPASMVPETPENILRRDYVPQLALLSHVDAVVTHAGHNTTVEALSHGLPLVVSPITDDQPVVAAQVTAAGAGVRVPFGRISANKLRDAVVAVLDEPAYRQAAARIATSFAEAGGPAQAAEAVLALASR